MINSGDINKDKLATLFKIAGWDKFEELGTELKVPAELIEEVIAEYITQYKKSFTEAGIILGKN